MIFFYPPKSPKAPSALLRGCTRGDCGGLIIPSSSRDHSPREAQRGAHPLDHTPWITLISFRGRFSSSEAQCRENWTEPGYGTQAYMDCITSQSEGSHCWELIRPRSDCSCFDFPYRGLVLEWLGKHRKVCGCQYGLRYGRYVREQIFSPFEIQFRQHLVQ